VLHALADDGLFENGLKVKTLHLPDLFQDHDTQGRMYAQAVLDAVAIASTAISLCRPGGAVLRAAGANGLRLLPSHHAGTAALHGAST